MNRTFLFIAFLSLGICATSAAGQSHPALTGSMSNIQYLVGTWNCSVDAMDPSGATVHQTGTLTFAEAPGNVLSQTIATPTYASFGFVGYNTQSNNFFQTNVNNMGSSLSETATMGAPGRVVFLGTGTNQGHTLSVRDTEEKISDTQIHSTSEVQIGGKWTKVADANCTKR